MNRQTVKTQRTKLKRYRSMGKYNREIVEGCTPNKKRTLKKLFGVCRSLQYVFIYGFIKLSSPRIPFIKVKCRKRPKLAYRLRCAKCKEEIEYKGNT